MFPPPSEEEDVEATALLRSICRGKGFLASSSCEREIFSRDSCGTSLKVSFSKTAVKRESYDDSANRFPMSIKVPVCESADRLYFQSYIGRGGHGVVAKYVGGIDAGGNYSTEFAVKVTTDEDESIVMKKLCKDATQCGMVNLRKLVDTMNRSKFRGTRRWPDGDTPVYHIMPVMDTLTRLFDEDFATMKRRSLRLYKVVVARICRAVLSQVSCALRHAGAPYLDLKASNILYTCGPDGDLQVKVGDIGSLEDSDKTVIASYPPPESPGRSGAVRFDVDTSEALLSWAMGTLFLQSIGPGACDGLEADGLGPVPDDSREIHSDTDDTVTDDGDDPDNGSDGGDDDTTVTDDGDGPDNGSDGSDGGTTVTDDGDDSGGDDGTEEEEDKHTGFTGNMRSKDRDYVVLHRKRLTAFYGPLIGGLLHPDPAERTKLRDLEGFLSAKRDPGSFDVRTTNPPGRRRAVGRRRPLRKEMGEAGARETI